MRIIDPTFFYDAIDEFAFNYDIYICINQQEPDEYGRTHITYQHEVIQGSLQTQGDVVTRSKSGNTDTIRYDFYCKSLYRIAKNDIIAYKNLYLIVNDVHEYDEFGVRSCSLNAIELSQYRDFAEYLKYKKGELIV